MPPSTLFLDAWFERDHVVIQLDPHMHDVCAAAFTDVRVSIIPAAIMATIIDEELLGKPVLIPSGISI